MVTDKTLVLPAVRYGWDSGMVSERASRRKDARDCGVFRRSVRAELQLSLDWPTVKRRANYLRLAEVIRSG